MGDISVLKVENQFNKPYKPNIKWVQNFYKPNKISIS